MEGDLLLRPLKVVALSEDHGCLENHINIFGIPGSLNNRLLLLLQFHLARPLLCLTHFA